MTQQQQVQTTLSWRTSRVMLRCQVHPPYCCMTCRPGLYSHLPRIVPRAQGVVTIETQSGMD